MCVIKRGTYEGVSKIPIRPVSKHFIRVGDARKLIPSREMDTRADDDEAPPDPAARKQKHHDYTEQDFEGHRAHTVFVGVHVPARRHSHRKHKHHHRNGEKDVERPVTPPAQRVQFILGEDVDDATLESHPLFSEMEELVKDGDELEWKETARWIKFEEDVEEGGNRWSKPHVATLSLHSLFELRSLILNGAVILDMEANSLDQIAENVLDYMVADGSLGYECRDKVKDALLRRHRHQHEKRNHNNMSKLPLIRSLADIGRNHSSCKNFQETGSHRTSTRNSHSSSSPQTALLHAPDARGSYLAVPGGISDEDAVTVLPPGEWDPAIRIEPPAAIPSQDIRKRPNDNNQKEEPDDEEEEQRQREESGTWTTIILVTLVAIDASAFVCYITRFTEENFATLIAFIFIYKAIENVISIGKKFPLKTHADEVLNYECFCLPSNYSRVSEKFNWTTVEKESCQLYNGTLVGAGCETKVYVPDVFLMSIILFLGTFTISIILKDFKNSLFFPSKVRQIISDFSVIIAILSMSFLDFKVGVKTPKLEVPSEFKPTLPTRNWVITPFNGNPIWSALVAILPALLGTILIFMDQQITAVIVNRKENKLKKGCGYHLDLFVLAILIQLCSVMGLPWHIPMPVLFGVFLYMGVASLKGLQFFDRILIMFMPQKYQPDHMFLRQVPIRRVHLFTAIQLTCLVCLWVIKSFSMTSILFPLMLVVMIGIRKTLDLFFTRREMKILDDVMPEMSRRNQDELHELGSAEDANKNNPPPYQENLQIPLINGNIMNIPLTSINISEEVNKSGIWKQVNSNNTMNITNEAKDFKVKSSKKNVKHKKLILKSAQSEIERRLSTMAEVEEDDPAAKSDILRRKGSWSGGIKCETRNSSSAETSV
ncbi:unnamed protein product, partial [Iphiclides podalirius]